MFDLVPRCPRNFNNVICPVSQFRWSRDVQFRVFSRPGLDVVGRLLLWQQMT